METKEELIKTFILSKEDVEEAVLRYIHSIDMNFDGRMCKRGEAFTMDWDKNCDDEDTFPVTVKIKGGSNG